MRAPSVNDDVVASMREAVELLELVAAKIYIGKCGDLLLIFYLENASSISDMDHRRSLA